MIHSFFHQIYVADLFTIMIIMVILLIAWSVFGAFLYKGMRLIGLIVSIAYTAIILYATVFSRGESSLGHDFIPFSSF